MPMFRLMKVAGVCTLLLAGCTTLTSEPVDTRPSILFIHGNGENAANWQTTIWRFESNGWPTAKLHTLDLPYPYARDDDTQPQAGRSSSADFMAYLKAEVEAIRLRTGQDKVVVVGAGRGGNAIRNYVQNGGGLEKISHAVLAGTPSHGIWAVKGYREQSEFSGLSNFMQGLNRPKDAAGNEVPTGIRWLTIRSDGNDKFARPTGEWIGSPLMNTNITARSPELKGAQSVVLPKADHRETAYSPAAFAAMYHFITNEAPKTHEIKKESVAELSGVISGVEGQNGGFPSNLPIHGARIEIYPVDASTGLRTGQAVHTQTVDETGRWGAFEARTDQTYEFVISARGYPTHHVYRSALPRSTNLMNFRLQRIIHADPDAKAIVMMSRPRGYFDLRRDSMSFGNVVPPPGIPLKGVAGVSVSRMKSVKSEPETVVARFNHERVAGRTWPLAEKRVVILEITE
ncbi:MAG: twin-arginine translocation pathway signal [Lautropia sp.]|nr:twin-arginine translocation pathway signal [Lautropia sp.]